MAAEYHLTLPAVGLDDAIPRARGHLQTLFNEVGFIPNMHARLANSPSLLEAYITGYKNFREHAEFSAVEQEVVLLTISRFNACGYCMAVHSTFADRHSDMPSGVVDAIRNQETIPHIKLSMLSTFTEIMLESQGKPSANDVSVFLNAGFTEKHMLEIILAISINTISNYANHIFHTEVDAAFSDRSWVAK